MYYNDDTIVYFKDKWVKVADAQINPYVQTLHYGVGVFEGIRAYDIDGQAHIFKAKEHYERLLYSAEVSHIKTDYSVGQLIDISYALLKKNNLTEAYIRPLICMGERMGLAPDDTSFLFMGTWEWPKYMAAEVIDIMTSSYQRPNPKSCHVEAKVTGHYINSLLSTAEAHKKGFNDALLLDMNGNVAEGSVANFFFEKDGTLYTCPHGNILQGITRATVIELAKEAGMPLEEKFFTPDEVRGADGAFFTGTAAEVAGIGSLDRVPFKLDWKDTMGYKLAQLYSERVNQSS